MLYKWGKQQGDDSRGGREIINKQPILQADPKKTACSRHENEKLLEQKIVNMETSSENMEKELIRWTNNFNSQLNSMQSTIVDLQNRNELLMTKNKSMETSISERNKMIEGCQRTIGELVEKVESVQVNPTRTVETEEPSAESYEFLLKEKDLKIESLKLKINLQNAMQNYKGNVRRSS